MSYENNKLIVNTGDRRFEMKVNEHIAFIEYKQGGNRVYLIHTEVPTAIEGKGVASALLEKTLHYLEEQQLRLVPLCAFVKSYLQKHQQWNRLVEEER